MKLFQRNTIFLAGNLLELVVAKKIQIVTGCGKKIQIIPNGQNICKSDWSTKVQYCPYYKCLNVVLFGKIKTSTFDFHEKMENSFIGLKKL